MAEIQLQFSTLISGSRLQHTLLMARATQRAERGRERDNDNEADDDEAEHEVGLQRRRRCVVAMTAPTG